MCCQVVSTTIQYLNCSDYGGESRVVSAQAIQCTGSGYTQGLVLMAVLLLLDCLLIPLAVFAHLCRNREKVKGRDKEFGKRWSILYGVRLLRKKPSVDP